MTTPVGIEIEVPVPNSVIITTQGPQGPAGLQNVVVSPTAPPPEDRFVNLVWIDTS